MEKGDIIKIEITDMTEEGAGIGHYDGLAVFVNGAVIGDVVRCMIKKIKKKFALSDVVETIKASEYRRVKPCPHIDSCGGCTYGALEYDTQLKLKVNQLKNKLVRISGIAEPKINEIIPYSPYLHSDTAFSELSNTKSQDEYQGDKYIHESGYRNKAVIAVGQSETGEPILGFRESRSHRIIDCKSCRIQLPPVMAITEAVRNFMMEYGIPGYDEENKKGLIRHVIARTAKATGEVMVVIVVNGNEMRGNSFPHGEELAYMLDDAVENLNETIRNRYNKENEDWTSPYSLESIVVNKNDGPINTILGEKSFILAGKSTIRDELMGLDFDISAESFYQINHDQTEKLYAETIRLLKPEAGEKILDIYCGIGTIGLITASKSNARFLGIESVPQAVRDANKNAIRNGIINAEFIQGRAEEVLNQNKSHSSDVAKERGKENKKENNSHINELLNVFAHGDGAILDPPRAGCDETLIDAVIKSGVRRVVYVSCDQGTMARDMKLFIEGGYILKETTPCDMFPDTGRLETVSLLSID